MAGEVQTLVGGLRAVELYYRPIRESQSGNTAFYQSQTRLNTPGLGTLMPENFREVAEVTNQCVNLFELEVVQAMEAAKKFVERDVIFEWLSVYMPAEYLRDIRAERNLMQFCERLEVHTNKICFNLSPKILEEQDGSASSVLKNLRNRGFHFMLGGFGANNCPMMRLSDFNVDYVMLSPEVTNFLGKSERGDNAVNSILDFISGLDAQPIADGVSSSMQVEKLFEYGCGYCAGPLTGKYVAERFIRRKKDE